MPQHLRAKNIWIISSNYELQGRRQLIWNWKQGYQSLKDIQAAVLTEVGAVTFPTKSTWNYNCASFAAIHLNAHLALMMYCNMKRARSLRCPPAASSAAYFECLTLMLLWGHFPTIPASWKKRWSLGNLVIPTSSFSLCFRKKKTIILTL